MASVRASVMNQARLAAQRLDVRADGAVPIAGPVVDQLVRCARLSQDAAHTLEWALHTLRAHSTGRADKVACELLRAAQERLDAVGSAVDNDAAATDPRQSLAWV